LPAGKITNCQIGVFASYVSHGYAFDDRELYLPKEWTDDADRLKAAHVPNEVGFATKPQIARQMIARALAAKVPFAFVAADRVYGTGDIATMLRKAGKAYVLGVAANHVFRSWGKKQLIGGTAIKIAQTAQPCPQRSRTRKQRWHGGPGTMDQKLAEILVAPLGGSDQTRFAAGRYLPGHQAELGRQVPSARKALGSADGRDRRSTTAPPSSNPTMLQLFLPAIPRTAISIGLYLPSESVVRRHYVSGAEEERAMARKFARQDILLVLDGAPNHRCGDLVVPDNIMLLYLPPYSPELNPKENLWDEIREKSSKAMRSNLWTPSAPSSGAPSSTWSAIPS
jgi:hypothetical protein